MNRRPPGLQLSIAVEGFLQYKNAEGLSQRTIRSYQRDLKQWISIHGDMDVTKVTTQSLRDYLTYMRSEYTPRWITGNNNRKLSSKTIRNIWISLSAFFHWESDEFSRSGDAQSERIIAPTLKHMEKMILFIQLHLPNFFMLDCKD